MQQWEYKVAYIDYRGRISVEGQETHIGDERRTTFVRHYLDALGTQGWELTSVQPLGQHDAYYIFKRQRSEGARSENGAAQEAASREPSDATISTL